MPTPTQDQTARRAGASWVAGTGAFMLISAAALFVAVRWEQVPTGAKLGALAVLTGAFLLGGRAATRTLPATGRVLYHVGAFLIPVDVAAFGLQLSADVSELLVAEGLAGLLLFPLLARSERRLGYRPMALEWATVAAGLTLAIGTDLAQLIPAGILLAAAAGAAYVVGFHRAVPFWATAAVLAPALTPEAELLSLGSAALAGIVLGFHATRTNNATWAFPIATAVVVGALDAWPATSLGATATLTTLAVGFVVIELLATFLGKDAFWGTPIRTGTIALEAFVAIATVPVMSFALASGANTWDSEPALLPALCFSTVAWLLADLRRAPAESSTNWLELMRRGGGSTLTPLAAAYLFTGALIGLETEWGAAALTTVAVLLVAGRRPWADATAAVFALTAVYEATASPIWVTLSVATTGALALATAFSRRVRIGTESEVVGAVLLAALAVWLIGVGALESGLPHVWTAVYAVGALAAVAAVMDRGDALAADAVRAMWLVPLIAAIDLPPEDGLLVGGVILGATLVEAVRTGRERILHLLGPAVALTAGAGALAVDVEPAWAGLAMVLSAVVVAGLSALTPPRWQIPGAGAAGLAATCGVIMASPEATPLGIALLVVGATVLGAGTVLRNQGVGLAGGAVAIVGTWVHLAAADVVALDLYTAPVALELLVAGFLSRRRGASSWLAYGLPIALLGGASFVERLDGGSGWHALVAGGVGLAAVALGGERRLQAPLLLGTGLLVAVVGYESLAVTAGVPTWAWLASAGCALLGAGVAMERAETGPVAVTRRLVDVLAERFE